MSLKIIDKNIRTITTNAAKINDLIHTTATMVLEHAREHGDCTRALTLVKAMPASFRRTMLVAWFEKYSPIRVVLANDRVGMLKETAKLFTPFDLEGAAAEPFHVIAEATPEEKPFDFARMMQMVEALGKRAQKMIDDGKVPEADLPSVTAAAEQIKGLRLVRVNGKAVEAIAA